MKRLLLIAFAVAAALAAHAYDFKVNGLCYNKNADGTSVTVTYEKEEAPRYASLSGALNIPSSVKSGGKTYTVTGIGENAFYDCDGITSLTIPNTVAAVGGSAFYACDGITTVTVGTSARTWGDYVFAYCSSLTTINWNVPDGVDFTWGGGTGMLSYGNPFYHASNIKTVVFGNNVKRIPSCFCRNFGNLSAVTIPSSVTEIATWAFFGCDALTKITIPSGVTKIGYEAFAANDGLTTVTIPASLTQIGDYAFRACTSLTTVNWNATSCNDDGDSYITARFNGCSNLKSFVFGSNVKRIPGELCFFMTSLTSISIPNSVTEIGANAFYKCTGLTSVSVGTGVKTVETNAFSECTSLNKVNITDLAAWCAISFSSYGSNPLYYAKNLYLNGTKVTNLSIPSSVTTIGDRSFVNCTSLTKLTVPSSVTSIGSYAFNGCTSLVSVTWNAANCSGVTGGAFDGLSGIKTFTFGNTVQTIPAYLCKNLTGLTQITIPNTITEIGKQAFNGCTGLTQVTIPVSVTKIGSNAFTGCTGLATVTWNAANCADLKYYAAFTGLTGIKTFNFGNTVKTIPLNLCYGLTGLTQITIPASVTSIGQDAFYGCTGLTKVNISDLGAWCGIDFGNASANPLYYAKNLYLGGEKLTKLTIPASVERVKKNAFINCEPLTSVAFHGNLTGFGERAFEGCTRLTQAIARPNAPQSLAYGTDVFLRIPSASTLYVPMGTANNYRQAKYGSVANPWLAFGSVVEWTDGDVNFDGTVNTGDVSAIYRLILNGDGNAALCDLNGDGEMNTGDISALYRLILGQ